MEIKCFCPHCGQEFSITVQDQGSAPARREGRNVSEDERQKRAERMRAMRAQGIGGRPKGSKNSHPRADKGMARKAPEGA